ncbi:MAG: hypothetical protein PHI85_08465 [Victivallaceae bacterium]|nr:hypothetical protein [Victivallaceae bacterium]
MWDCEKIIDLCRRSAQIALRYYNAPPIELKSDKSVVTAADREVEELLTAELTADGSYFIGEETVGGRGEHYVAEALTAARCWVVDPIDGTAPYSCMLPAWGHSIALMEHGKITEGAIYLPVQDELFITDGDAVRHVTGLGTATPKSSRFVFPPAAVTTAKPVAVPQCLVKSGTIGFDNVALSLCGCVGAAYFVMTGKFLGYLAVVKLWDIAAVGAIYLRGGYTGVNESGRNFTLDVNNATYDLNASSPDRWRMRGAAAFAANREICDFILANVHRGEGKK